VPFTAVLKFDSSFVRASRSLHRHRIHIWQMSRNVYVSSRASETVQRRTDVSVRAPRRD
jgi:hypothetical protein